MIQSLGRFTGHYVRRRRYFISRTPSVLVPKSRTNGLNLLEQFGKNNLILLPNPIRVLPCREPFKISNRRFQRQMQHFEPIIYIHFISFDILPFDGLRVQVFFV